MVTGPIENEPPVAPADSAPPIHVGYYDGDEDLSPTERWFREIGGGLPGEVPEVAERGLGEHKGNQAGKPKRRRAHSHFGPQFGEEEGVGTDDGRPPYFQPYEPLAPEERAARLAALSSPVHRAIEARRIVSIMDAAKRRADAEKPGDVNYRMAIERAMLDLDERRRHERSGQANGEH